MKKIISLLLVVSMMFLVACGKQENQVEPVAEKTNVRFGLLNGPTGIGASYLLEKNENDEALNNYEVNIVADPSDMAAQVIAGQLDIAALPTNLAATIYNKNQSIKLLALNTAGVLYIASSDETISSFEDLKGRTIYATGQGANPEYVLNYILSENGLVVGEDVTVEFFDSQELVSKAVSGEVDVVMLPVPALTTVLMKNENMKVVFDLSEKWDELNTGSMLTMGCVVVNNEFYQNNTQAVDNFLKEYEESINYVKANPEQAGELCEKFEIVSNKAVASKAIPDSHLIFYTGSDVRNMIEGYYQVLFEANPKAIGGAMPSEEFYITE